MTTTYTDRTKMQFGAYFDLADELSAQPTGIFAPLTLDDFEAWFVNDARAIASDLSLPWPPDMTAAEDYALDNPEIRR